MTEFVVCAAVLLVAMVPIGMVAWRATVLDAVIAYEAASSIAVIELLLLPEGFGRPAEFEFPVLVAVLLLSSSLVFVHAFERWL